MVYTDFEKKTKYSAVIDHKDKNVDKEILKFLSTNRDTWFLQIFRRYYKYCFIMI